MPQSNQLRNALSALRKAQLFESKGISTSEGMERIAAAGAKSISRRDLLKVAGFATIAATPMGAMAKSFATGPRIAIVGGGLSGLACADQLRAKGYSATIYEGNSRLGGRCYSNRTLVNGMAAENGGELIDTGHKTMLAYANEFGLPVESYIRKRGHESFYFMGQNWTEEQVVDEFRAVVAIIQDDLHSLGGAASFFTHNDADVELDNTDLQTYFETRCAGFPLIRTVLDEAYVAEYGLETWQQSTLNFLGFMRLNKQSRFEPFGISDERYHVATGNDGIASGIASRLPGAIETGAMLTKLSKNISGQFLLYFNGGSIPEVADTVVLTMPFTTLRKVTLDPSLGLSDDKLRAIQTLGYGNNAKTMIAFNGRPWEELHGNGGGVYSDLPNVQNTWETNRARSTTYGIITDYASGARGASLKTSRVQQQVGAFLTNFDTILPGTKARAAKNGSKYVAHLEHWPSSPYSLGSYSCYNPGQFTTVLGLEPVPAGLLRFGGEHADSYYLGWQGYMEGGLLSGIRTANEVLADIKSGVI